MKKVFDMYGFNAVEFTSCTAINNQSGKRENAIFVHYKNPMCSNWDGILFGASMPENEEEAKSILQEYQEYDDAFIYDTDIMEVLF